MKDIVAGLVRALEEARRPHVVVEDCWYSCPASGECCNDEAGERCDCGADAHNAAIDAAILRATTTSPHSLAGPKRLPVEQENAGSNPAAGTTC